MKKLLFIGFAALVSSLTFAAIPSGYYSSAEGKCDNNLRQALYQKIKSHTDVGYNGLWTLYGSTDLKSDGKIWDMYSNCTFTYKTNQCGTYSDVCSCYNREHSVPQSWFNEASPMKADAFHVYPTDGRVNGQRANYEFGECSGGTSLGGKALGRLGNSTFAGYTNKGKVFEPDDQYKGDFARTYFYMATCYADKCSNWGHTFGNINGLTDYGVALFLKWHRQDPVSQKEIDRNNAVYEKQKNRNPFIDHPELAEHIWGNKKSEAWYESQTPVENVAQPIIEVFCSNTKELMILTESNNAIDYQIFDISGKKLMSGTTVANTSLSVSDLNSGIYLIRLNVENQMVLRKFVLSK